MNDVLFWHGACIRIGQMQNSTHRVNQQINKLEDQIMNRIVALTAALLLTITASGIAKDNATFTTLHTRAGYEVSVPKTLADDGATLAVAWNDVKVREIASIDFRESAVMKINSKGEIFVDGYATVVTQNGKTMKGYTRVYTN